MTTSDLVSTFLPVALGLIMFSLGITLTRADFERVAKTPKAVLAGLFVQLILVPLLAFGLAKAFALSPVLAVGLMLLAASPGGVTANLYSHLAGGDVALNVTLTAVNSVIAAVSVPLLVWISMSLFLAQDQFIGFQFRKMIEVFVIVLVPVFLGMLVNARNPQLRPRLEKPFNTFSVVFLLAIVIAAILKERQLLMESLAEVGLVTLLFNLGSLGMGYGMARALRLTRPQAIGIGMELGIHNVTLAVYLAYNVLENPKLAIPGAVYAIVMNIVALSFIGLLRRGNAALPTTAHK